MNYETLKAVTIRFTECFNANDLDGVMDLMAEDAVYEEFTGVINRGKAAIRAAFALAPFPGRAIDYSGHFRRSPVDLVVHDDVVEPGPLIHLAPRAGKAPLKL